MFKSSPQLAGKYSAKDFYVQFDPSMRIPDQWISPRELACFNVLREEMTIKNFHNRSSQPDRFAGDQMGFCHHCKQIKTTYIIAPCKYDTRRHGHLLPTFSIVNGVRTFNIEPQCSDIINALLLRQMVKEKKRKRKDNDNEQTLCNKQFCSFCIKTYYDLDFQEV